MFEISEEKEILFPLILKILTIELVICFDMNYICLYQHLKFWSGSSVGPSGTCKVLPYLTRRAPVGPEVAGSNPALITWNGMQLGLHLCK